VRICSGRAVNAASASGVSQCLSFSRRRIRYQAFSEKYNEQYHRSYNFKWKVQRIRCTVATHSNDSGRYAFRVQTFAISCATRFCSDHQQSTRTITTSVWTKFGKSMLLTWTTVLAHALENLPIYSCTHQKEKQKILYIQKLFID
jgi:hypothetical protein